MTARLILKALRLLWPYLRSAIFKDRTVTEVIRENSHLTIMMGLLLTLMVALSITTLKLSALKENRLVKQVSVATEICTCTTPFDKRRLKTLLEENN